MTKTITTCYCDRCGEEMPNRLEYGYGTHPNTAIEILRDKWEYADLCDKCKESFKAWWKKSFASPTETKARDDMNKEDTKQAILGFAEFFKGITGNQNLKIPDDIAKKYEIESNRWIPVSERLPEKNMECLVAVGKFNLTQMAMYSDLMGIKNSRIFYQGYFGDDSFEDITQYVNAWMPLPEPYKASPTGEEVEE